MTVPHLMRPMLPRPQDRGRSSMIGGLDGGLDLRSRTGGVRLDGHLEVGNLALLGDDLAVHGVGLRGQRAGGTPGLQR